MTVSRFGVGTLGITVLVTIGGGLAPAQPLDQFVTSTGSFATSGSPARPHHQLRSVFCDDLFEPGATIHFSPEAHHQLPGVYDRPSIWTTTGGTAVITARATAETSVRVACWNVRLWPDWINESTLGFGNLEFRDRDRAGWIGPRLGDLGADIVGLQEVWTDDYIAGRLDTAFNWFHFGGSLLGEILPSGLLTLSQARPADPVQVEFTASASFPDNLAAKGFTRSLITIDGFQILFYNTHLDAEDAGVRVEQMSQIRLDLQDGRLEHPSAVLVVVGDFNARRNGSEYFSMEDQFELVGLTDAAPSEACSADRDACTSCPDNELRQFFSGDDSSSKIIDYVLYSPSSADGTVRAFPVGYDVQRPVADTAGFCNGSTCTAHLSDHELLLVDLRLRRVVQP